MDVFCFETREGVKITIHHGQVDNSHIDSIKAGDHIFQIFTPSGSVGMTLTDEQWGQFVDGLSASLQFRRN